MSAAKILRRGGEVNPSSGGWGVGIADSNQPCLVQDVKGGYRIVKEGIIRVWHHKSIYNN
jgi:hypothetical protein